MEKECPYGFGKSLSGDFPEAVKRTKQALQNEGFGVLSEIDVTAKMKEKLGVDFRPYLILGACNPRLAHQALQEEINLGMLLPCNVILYQEGEKTVVMAMDPEAALTVVGNPAVEEVARQVKAAMERVMAAL